MKNEQLLGALSNCINHCNHCADACLDEDDVKKMVPCIKLDRVCASVCATVADVLATNYKDIQGLMNYCVEICEKCAAECGKHEADHCKACADACRQCAEACKAYAA